MSNIYVTDIPFSDLKKGHRLQGVNGTLGTIIETETKRDEIIGDEKDSNLVRIMWSEDQAEPVTYKYEILSKVLVIGEPSGDIGNMVLTSVEYDETDRSVDESVFEIGTEFTIEGVLLDADLNAYGHIAIESHDVVVVAPFGIDPETIDTDIFNYIDENIRVTFEVTENYKLLVKEIHLQ